MPSSPTVTSRTELARRRAAWDEVMSGFVPALATCEETLCVAAEAATAGAGPRRVLDLGGGPGLFAERLTRRWPTAAVTLLDLDPVLLGLARAALPAAVTVVEADLASDDWPTAAGTGYDLVTSVMTMHYLPPARVRAVYRAARTLLAPGGLLLVADLMPDDGLPGLMRALNPGPGEAAAGLAWAQWWAGITGAAELRPQVTARAALFGDRPPADFTAGPAWHVAAAREAGFTEAGAIWRAGRYAALAAVAPR